MTWAGWLVQTDEFYLIVDPATASARLPELARSLALIGIDRISGYFDAAAIHGDRRIPQITATDLAPRLSSVAIVDVRGATEWESGHLPGAIHIPLGHLADRAGELPAGRPVVVHCQSGGRSAIAASVLERLGHSNVTNLIGGITAWAAAGQPIEGASHEAQATRA